MLLHNASYSVELVLALGSCAWNERFLELKMNIFRKRLLLTVSGGSLPTKDQTFLTTCLPGQSGRRFPVQLYGGPNTIQRRAPLRLRSTSTVAEGA